MMSYDYPHPVSRTYQYKKITKPLLERKRRARINRCLEELKDLMVDALETEGENISKLEKADILELTVRHLQRLQISRPSGLSVSASPKEEAEESRWQSGFGHCAAEACRFLASLPGEAADRLARHLSTGLQSPKPKNEQDVSRADLVSPTLKNLEKTASIIAPCQPLNSSIETGTSVIVEKRIMSPNGPTQQHVPKPEAMNGRLESSKSPYSRPQSMINSDDLRPSIIRRNSELISKNDDFMSDDRYIRNSISKTDNLESIIDDEEEIDVVRIDDSCDPMWRPW